MSSAARLPMAVEPDGEFWFVVQTRFRFEKKVAAELAAKGMCVFLPLRKENRSWGDRKKEVFAPVFPGLLFVFSDHSLLSRIVVLQTAGVMGFISKAGVAATVSPNQISSLQLLLAEQIQFSSHPAVRTGERVRIQGGRLDGIEGLRTQREPNRLLLCIDAIQRCLAIDLQGCRVEAI
jgi:transcription antitermination factor NusG